MHHLERAVDKATILDAVQILDILIDYSVAIKHKPSPEHDKPAVLLLSSSLPRSHQDAANIDRSHFLGDKKLRRHMTSLGPQAFKISVGI